MEVMLVNLKIVDKLIEEINTPEEFSFLAYKDRIEIIGTITKIYKHLYRVTIKVLNRETWKESEWSELSFGKQRSENKLRRLAEDLKEDGWTLVDEEGERQ